nr:hypothetical protein [uncultured Sunxiuqinia sp.]
MKMIYRLGLLFLAIIFLFSCNRDVKFNSEEWKKAGGENITTDKRSTMVNDLIEREILLNKTEPEILKMIGYPSRLHGQEIDSIKYFAVQEYYSWGDIDPKEMTFLKIIFGKDGKSNSIEIFSTK